MEPGPHIAGSTCPGGAAALGPSLARTARDAKAAGIGHITVMDRFWQL
ncbi:hypothetical protein ABGB17_34285 [Sphaerisporangium sp. B11E5]